MCSEKGVSPGPRVQSNCAARSAPRGVWRMTGTVCACAHQCVQRCVTAQAGPCRRWTVAAHGPARTDAGLDHALDGGHGVAGSLLAPVVYLSTTPPVETSCTRISGSTSRTLCGSGLSGSLPTFWLTEVLESRTRGEERHYGERKGKTQRRHLESSLIQLLQPWLFATNPADDANSTLSQSCHRCA